MEIFGKKFPVFLDNGSTICLLGDKVIEHLQHNNVKFHDESKRISGIFAGKTSQQYVNLDINLKGLISNERFALVPGYIDYVLLGDNYLTKHRCALFSGEGFKLRNYSDELFPFSPFTGPFVKSPIDEEEASLLINEDRLDDACQFIEDDSDDPYIPASVLANWADNLEDCDEVDDDSVEENLVSLFPEKGENFLLVPQELETEKKEKLRKVFEPFLQMFTETPGECNLVEHEILTPGANPVNVKYQPMSMGKRLAFDSTFDDLVKWGVIEPSTSPWAANAFVKQNADGTYRFLVNFKGLNSVTKVDKYPIPCIDTIFTYLGKAMVFSVFDILKGFFQISIKPEHREKTAFRSHRGLWQFRKMAQGMLNSPATFQRCMDSLLAEFLYVFCFIFFDDSLTYSEDFESHCEHLTKVLQKFHDAGFTINPRKVQLCRRRLKYLGFIIEPGRISPNPDKVKRIREIPIPSNLNDLQRFLGSLSFYRRFIPGFAEIAAPLYKISSPIKEFVWSDECTHSFEKLKDGLANFTQVYLPDLNREFIITTDGSRKAIAAVLS